MNSITRTLKKPSHLNLSRLAEKQEKKTKLLAAREAHDLEEDQDQANQDFEAEENEDGEFEVESILDKKIKKGVTYYRVKWKGYDLRYATWEPEKNLKNAPNKIEIFEKGLLNRTLGNKEEDQSEEAKERKMVLLRKREWQDLRSKRKSQHPDHLDGNGEENGVTGYEFQQGRKIIKPDLITPSQERQVLKVQGEEGMKLSDGFQNKDLKYFKINGMAKSDKESEKGNKSLETSKEFKNMLQHELDKYKRENQESAKALSSIFPNKNGQPNLTMTMDEQLKAINSFIPKERAASAHSDKQHLIIQDNTFIQNPIFQSSQKNNFPRNDFIFNPQFPLTGAPDLYPQYLPMNSALINPLLNANVGYLPDPLLKEDPVLKNLITSQRSLQISNPLFPQPRDLFSLNANRLGSLLPPIGFDPTQSLLLPKTSHSNNLVLKGGITANSPLNNNSHKRLGLPRMDPLISPAIDPLSLSTFQNYAPFADLLLKNASKVNASLSNGMINPFEASQLDNGLEAQMKSKPNDKKVLQNPNGIMNKIDALPQKASNQEGMNLNKQPLPKLEQKQQQKIYKNFSEMNRNNFTTNEQTRSAGSFVPK